MAIFDFKCNKCNFINEYNTSFSVPKKMRPPSKCPKCKKGKMEKLFSVKRQGLDFVGPGFFINDYGKHNWKRNLSLEDQTKVLNNEMNPY